MDRADKGDMPSYKAALVALRREFSQGRAATGVRQPAAIRRRRLRRTPIAAAMHSSAPIA